jgi:hypothetical protein
MVMVQKNGSIVILATVAVAVVLQVILIFADFKDTPVKAAVEFSKDYFLLKESMADRLCRKLGADEEIDPVKELITTAGLEAKARGFGLGMMRRSLTHIETEVISQDANTAKIQLHAISRVCINPVFAWVATLFKLGETHQEEAVLSLVKEGGCWKVCGHPFGLAGV